MSHFVIQGKTPLAGELPVYGSKNAALPLLAAALLTDAPVTLSNLPDIVDVRNMLNILRAIGVSVASDATTHTLTAATLTPDRLPDDGVGKLRGSILLLGALLGRHRQAKLVRPGGDLIGARPISAHLDAFAQLGAVIREEGERVHIDGANMRAGTVVLSEFSVTATENILLAAATLPGTTTIKIAAAEPHVAALATLLTRMGAPVTGAGTHELTITGTAKLGGADFTNIPDMLEAGSFILLAAATGSPLTITNVPLADLTLFLKHLQAIGLRLDVDAGARRVTVTPGPLQAFRLQSLPHPGIATDLQAPFAVIATQAAGTSLIHDPLYEKRFRHIAELQKMGATATVLDPHRVTITGPTPLKGQRIQSLDIRSGMSLVIAALVAEGETTIADAEIIDRGYANLDVRLQQIGATIRREPD